MPCYPGIFVLSLGDVADLLVENKPRIAKGWASSGGGWAEYNIARVYWRAEAQKAVMAGADVGPLLSGFNQAIQNKGFTAAVGMNEYLDEFHTDMFAWKRAIALEKAFAAVARQNGLDYFALSMPTHNLPPKWVVEELARDPNITGLSLHLYALERPMQQEPEVARYKGYTETCSLPVLIGETGRDGIGRNVGWQLQGIYPRDFAEEMRWLTANLPAWGFTAFAFGCTQDWRDKGFELKDNAEFRDLIRGFDYTQFRRPERKQQTGGGTPVTKAYIALCPSLQDGNVSDLQPAGFGRYNEAGGMQYLAGEVEKACAAKGITAKVFWTWPESVNAQHGGTLSGVKEQMRLAFEWLRQIAVNSPNAAVLSFHTDSGSKGHTFGIHGARETRTPRSYDLASAIVDRVGPTFQHTDVRIFSKLGDIDYSEYVFWKNTAPWPSVLIELCSHQNADDLAILYEQPIELADAIVRGILAWAVVPESGPQPTADMTAAERLAEVKADIAALAKKWSV